jgi:hypothetical protein
VNNRVSAFFLRLMYALEWVPWYQPQLEIHCVCDLRATAAAADSRYSATR